MIVRPRPRRWITTFSVTWSLSGSFTAAAETKNIARFKCTFWDQKTMLELARLNQVGQ